MLDGQSRAGRVAGDIATHLSGLGLAEGQVERDRSRVQKELFLLRLAAEAKFNKFSELEQKARQVRGPLQHSFNRKTNFEEAGALGSSLGT